MTTRRFAFTGAAAGLASLFLGVLYYLVQNAPLEAPADPNKTPNPSKASWYYLGIQELLVYADPWLSGVILPALLVGLLLFLVGLCAVYGWQRWRSVGAAHGRPN